MTNRIAFAVFAAAILFSMIREWSEPSGCLLPPVVRGANGIIGR